MINVTLIIGHDASDDQDHDETVDVRDVLFDALRRTFGELTIVETNPDQTVLSFSYKEA